MQAKNSEDTYPVPIWYLRETFECNTYIEDPIYALKQRKKWQKVAKTANMLIPGPFEAPKVPKWISWGPVTLEIYATTK